MSNVSNNLKKAYKLIKRDKTDEAWAILRPILDDNPENVDAWWLLAYAVEEPDDVREALTKVLELDPTYSNAAKAREMLNELNKRFPPNQDTPSGLEDLFSEEEALDEGGLFAEDPFIEAELDDGFDDAFGDVFSSDEDDLFLTEDGFEDLKLEDYPLDEAEELGLDSEKGSVVVENLRAMLDEEDASLNDDARATLTARSRSKRWRLSRFALLLLSVLVIFCVVLLMTLNLSKDSDTTDPGRLKSIEVQSDELKNVLVAAENQLDEANLGSEHQVIVAEGELGDTLFIEICDLPNVNLSHTIAESMQIAVHQAPLLTDQFAAVGVSVDLCTDEEHDTLYRASVSVDNAIHYINGELGIGEAGIAAFQSLWEKS